MDTQMERKTLHTVSPQSHMLAKKARRELLEVGTTTVLCPRCEEYPEIITTLRGERTIVSCGCGFVYDVEMNL